jgi:A/G-specific adenine glycosylase
VRVGDPGHGGQDQWRIDGDLADSEHGVTWADILSAVHRVYNGGAGGASRPGAGSGRPEGGVARSSGSGSGSREREAARALLRWYRRHRRDLPWRRGPDPYRILVSEVMLQQTTVDTAAPYFERFLAAFPDVRALAAAPDEKVLALWSGLGYYRRARNLAAAARIIVRDHAGIVPRDLDALRALPGVGPYTAAAVSAIAHGRPEVALDGNLRRVLARLAACRGDPRARRGEEAVLGEGRALVAAADPSSVNQALMDLGAMVCLPRAPRCPSCPLARFCRARALGIQAAIPPHRRPARSVSVDLAAGVVRLDGRILLVRRAGDLMRGMWEVPMAAVAGGEAEEAFARRLRACTGLRPAAIREAGSVRHTITRHRLRVRVLDVAVGRPARSAAGPWLVAEPGAGRAGGAARLVELAGGSGEPALEWVGRARIASLPLTGLARKVLAAARRRRP